MEIKSGHGIENDLRGLETSPAIPQPGRSLQHSRCVIGTQKKKKKKKKKWGSCTIALPQYPRTDKVSENSEDLSLPFPLPSRETSTYGGSRAQTPAAPSSRLSAWGRPGKRITRQRSATKKPLAGVCETWTIL